MKFKTSEREEYLLHEGIEEPYHDFLYRNGFKVDEDLTRITDCFRQKTLLEGDSGLEGLVLPQISKERVVFYEGDVCFKHGRERFGSSEKCLKIHTLEDFSKKGTDVDHGLAAMMLLAYGSGCKAWQGYIVRVETSDLVQTIVMKDDGEKVSQKMEYFYTSAANKIGRIYGRLDSSRLAEEIPASDQELRQYVLHHCGNHGLMVKEKPNHTTLCPEK